MSTNDIEDIHALKATNAMLTVQVEDLEREIEELKNDVGVKCMEKVNLRNEAKQLKHSLAQTEQDTKRLVSAIKGLLALDEMEFGDESLLDNEHPVIVAQQAISAMKETKP